jgi:uncharacterized protein (DUF1501 family)
VKEPNMTNSPQTPCGCPDFSTSRRRFLATAAAGGVGIAGASLFGDAFRQVTYGGTPGDSGNVLLVLSLRGGADGLSMVVPRGADHDTLAGYRQGIVVPADSLIGGNAQFGLHPAFDPLLPMWNAGTFGAVHAVGLPQPNRSHFDAMEVIEDADPGSSARVGWINRMVGLDSGATTQTAFNLGSSLLPTSQVGPAPALGAYRVADMQVAGLGPKETRKIASLQKMWAGDKSGLGDSMRSTLAVVNQFGDLSKAAGSSGTELDDGSDNPDNPVNSSLYPPGQLQSVLSNTAALIKADLGTEIITVDYGNWDMHNGLGGNDPGQGWMHDQVDHLAKSMVAFFDDLGPAASRVTVVTISEFGRRVEENGDHGVDHGYGNAMLLLGAGVNGGDVHGGWPGLASLTDGDLSINQDYRSVLWPVLTNRFPRISGDKAKVFPGFAEDDVAGLMA